MAKAVEIHLNDILRVHYKCEIDREDIANPLIGREDFVIYRSDTEIELIRRGQTHG